MNKDSSSDLLRYLIAQGVTGESEIKEHVEWKPDTKAWVQLAQAVTVFVGLIALCSGAALIAYGLMEFGAEWWSLPAIGVGTCLVISGALLTYRQSRELLDPYGKMSPMERMLKPYMGDVFGGMAIDPEGRVLPRHTIEVQVKDKKTTNFLDAAWLELSDDSLVAFARGLSAGRGLAEGAWSKDRTAFPQGINEFRAVRSRLVQAGLVRRESTARNAAFVLTAAGKTGFQAIVDYANEEQE